MDETQPVAHEQRKALEKEDELKRKLKLDILKVEKFYATKTEFRES